MTEGENRSDTPFIESWWSAHADPQPDAGELHCTNYGYNRGPPDGPSCQYLCGLPHDPGYDGFSGSGAGKKLCRKCMLEAHAIDVRTRPSSPSGEDDPLAGRGSPCL